MRSWQKIVLSFLALLLAGCAPPAQAVPPPTPAAGAAEWQALSEWQTIPSPSLNPAAFQPNPSPSTTARTPTPSPTVTRAPTRIPPTPTHKPWPSPGQPAAALPAAAEVKGMFGYGQLLPLSCEARSAADWARHFGITIHELEFLARLPKSPDPELGFVGSPYGGWGRIPPDAYGVHARPVAKVLQGYGAEATALKGMSFDRLRDEIAQGRPVMVWVTGHVAAGKSTTFSLNGKKITVARFEHTVIAIGYDEKTIHILDGKSTYQRTLDVFQQSWAALGNMAIIWQEQPNQKEK